MNENQHEDEVRSDGGYLTGFEGFRESKDTTNGQSFLPIARTEYRLAIRNRWAVALTIVFAAFSLGLVTFSGASIGPEGFNRVVASLAVLAVYLIPLGALAFGYDAIVGAHEDGWLAALFALPVDRWKILLATYLGRAVALTAAVVIGFGAAGAILLREFGLQGLDAFTVFLFGSVGLALAFLGIAVLLSTIAREKTHALGAALVVWMWFVLIHDLLSLGVAAAVQLPDWSVAAMILSNPAGIYRVIVLGELGATGDAGFASIMATAGLEPVVLLFGLLLWITVPLIIAGLIIQRRRT